MSNEVIRPENRWVMGGGALVLLLVAGPLWLEFREPGQTVWNVLLAAMLIGVLIAAYRLQRFFRANIGEIGEARFDTRNESERNV